MQITDALSSLLPAPAANLVITGRPTPVAEGLSFAQHLEREQDPRTFSHASRDPSLPDTGLPECLVQGDGRQAEPTPFSGQAETDASVSGDKPLSALQEFLSQLMAEPRTAPEGQTSAQPAVSAYASRDRKRTGHGLAERVDVSPVRTPPDASAAGLPSTTAVDSRAGTPEASARLASTSPVDTAPAMSLDPAGSSRPSTPPPASIDNAGASGATPATPDDGTHRSASDHGPAGLAPDARETAGVRHSGLPSLAGLPARSGEAGKARAAAETGARPSRAVADSTTDLDVPAAAGPMDAGASTEKPEADSAAITPFGCPTPATDAANPLAPLAAAAAPAPNPAAVAAGREGRATETVSPTRRGSAPGIPDLAPVVPSAREPATEAVLAPPSHRASSDAESRATAPIKERIEVATDSAWPAQELAARRTPDDSALLAGPTSPAATTTVPPPPAGSEPARPAGPSLELTLPAPVGSAHFREALNLQVSTFARDGVQHAELHLNPADMGPLSVQIALDGQQAQVHFGCDSAQTRQIVEAGLPALAAALRDAGLTLSGGGVSQHAPGQRQPARQGSTRDSGVEPAAHSDGRTVHTLRLPAGRLDTYA